jgi:Mrp family chromosome partitioning ATPase/capsular polysaccharide biosynthesis protein
VLLLPLAFGILAYVLVTAAGRTYTASATLLVYPVAFDLPGAPADVESAISLARSYAALVRAPDVLSGAAFALGVPETSATLRPRVSAHNEPDTQVIVVSVDDRDAARSAALANAVATTFIRWIGDRNAAAGSDPVRVVLVGPAEVPLQPNGPPVEQVVGLAALLGLLLAALLVPLLDGLDRRIWSDRDVRRAVDLPVAARLTRGWSLWPRSRLIVLTAPLSRSGDALRSLWMRLGVGAAADTPQALKAIVVTSAGPARATSAVAANLALSIAQAGQRVVLVDASLREPRLDRLFKLPGRAGLSELLAGAGGWISDHLVDGPVPELKLMLAGALPRAEREQFAVRPLELATAVELLVTALHASGDLVIVDAPPLLDASEALVFARLASRLIVVVQEGQTRPDVLARALHEVGAGCDGGVSLVLTDRRW